MRVRLSVAAVMLSSLVLHSDPATAGGQGTCSDIYGIGTQTSLCFSSGAELTEYVNSSEGAGFAYRLSQLCADEGDQVTCDNPRACVSGGESGTLYSVLRRPLGSPAAEWVGFAVVCLTAGEEPRFEVITWQRVFAVMRSLAWPSAELVVQPVGGRTLVNFETNFFTTRTQPVVRSVRLLGREVAIEATPVGYAWHWGDGGGGGGDGGGELVTEGAGASHVDGEPHEVFHVYPEARVVRPWVDVTYRGRYRVEGEGWRRIPETLTVAGERVELEVVTARVHLVG